MSDGGPDVTGPRWVRDPLKLCKVCAVPGCVPVDHVDEVLSHEDARRFAQVVLDEAGLTDTRACMLARYILSLSVAAL